MPYTRPSKRAPFDALDQEFASVCQDYVVTAGDLNYLITRLILTWLGGVRNYDILNTVVGVLESIKLEFYRRVVALYEDKKRFENGEVYQ